MVSYKEQFNMFGIYNYSLTCYLDDDSHSEFASNQKRHQKVNAPTFRNTPSS